MGEGEQKKGLWQRLNDKKRGPAISDEDILKYTGKTRAEFNDFKDNTPGVAGNQLAGKLGVGDVSGLGGQAAGAGLGGWGPGAGESGPNRGLKFPPEQNKKLTEED